MVSSIRAQNTNNIRSGFSEDVALETMASEQHGLFPLLQMETVVLYFWISTFMVFTQGLWES